MARDEREEGGVRLARGELRVSVRQCAAAWGWPSKTAHRMLIRLERDGVVQKWSDTPGTVLTLCDSSLFSVCAAPSDTPDHLDAIHARITRETGLPMSAAPTVAERAAYRAYLAKGLCEDEIVATVHDILAAAAAATGMPRSILDMEPHMVSALTERPPAPVLRRWAQRAQPGAAIARQSPRRPHAPSCWRSPSG